MNALCDGGSESREEPLDYAKLAAIENALREQGADTADSLLGVSPSGFRNYVPLELLPKPKTLGTRFLWDVSELINSLRSQENNPSGAK